MDAVPLFLPRLGCRFQVRLCHGRLYFLAPEEAPDPLLDWLEPEVPLEKPEPPDVCEEDHLSPADWASQNTEWICRAPSQPIHLIVPQQLSCFYAIVGVCCRSTDLEPHHCSKSTHIQYLEAKAIPRGMETILLRSKVLQDNTCGELRSDSRASVASLSARCQRTPTSQGRTKQPTISLPVEIPYEPDARARLGLQEALSLRGSRRVTHYLEVCGGLEDGKTIWVIDEETHSVQRRRIVNMTSV